MKYLLVMLPAWFGVGYFRDRLRCPDCGAVGTYKPHGGWLDPDDDGMPRRWLCKWCGFYKNRNYSGEYAARTCVVDPKAGCWRPREEASRGSKTVPEVLEDYRHGRFAKTWPWRG